jgi:hypothetical protein
MTKIDVKLSDLSKDSAIFHDLRYANDCEGGNRNETKFEICNLSGNTIDIQIGFHELNAKTNKWQWKWKPLTDMDGVRIKIMGQCENREFLQMLQLILETEKMVEIIKP